MIEALFSLQMLACLLIYKTHVSAYKEKIRPIEDQSCLLVGALTIYWQFLLSAQLPVIAF